MECRHCRAVVIATAVLTGAGFDWLWCYVFPDAGPLAILTLSTAVLLGAAAAVAKIVTPKRPAHPLTPRAHRAPQD